MPGIHVLVTAAYAAYSPGNILRSALSSKGILLLKNLKLAIKKTTTETGLHKRICVPTDHTNHPRYPGCLIYRYTPCFITLCSGLLLVWMMWVNAVAAVTSAALRRQSPRIAHASPTHLIESLHRLRFHVGNNVSSVQYSNTAKPIAHTYGALISRLLLDTVSRLYRSAMRNSERW